MKKVGILGIVLMLLFLVLPVASAHIDIVVMGTVYDGEDHYGYVDYQNIANYNVSGAILVFIDGDVVAGNILDMPIRYIAGFQCSPITTIEFPLNETEGDHRIVAYVFSMNSSVERTYEYYAAGWWQEAPDEEEVELGEIALNKEWLSCWEE